MADNQQPSTKQDLIDFMGESRGEWSGALADTKTRLVTAMRQMTGEILRELENFSQDYFARLDRLGRSKIELNKRLKGLEDRVTALETRPPTR
jgi:hypothetical protein